jgi:hypothetical protein
MAESVKDSEIEEVDKTEKEEKQEVQPAEPSPEEVLKQQEALLRKKYGDVKGGSSAFLQKRLSKGNNKYFDSGDYNMAKAKVGAEGAKPTLAPGQKLLIPAETTGGAIPTPETVPHRKLNLHQSKLAGMS